MTSLPKRGDRVRVTEAATGLMMVTVGQEFTLANDAREHPQHPGFIAFSPAPSGWVSPVKVEILERAGDTFTLTCRKCGRSMQLVRRMLGASQDTTVDECALCEEERASAHPEFARGMRRAVEIARELEAELGQYDWFSVGELSEAVEKELADD